MDAESSALGVKDKYAASLHNQPEGKMGMHLSQRDDFSTHLGDLNGVKQSTVPCLHAVPLPAVLGLEVAN